jgi:hypothetical protein
MELVSKQLSSKLRQSVTEKATKGKDYNVERLDNPNATLAVVSSRHADTSISDLDHSRRVAFAKSYARAYMIDDEDKVRMLADPTSEYVQEIAGEFNRTIDDVIIEAFLGNANSGETGSTTVALPAGQQIAHSTAGLTLAKLKQARKILLSNNVDLDRDTAFVATNAAGWEDLLTDTGLVSRDFVSTLPNETGELPQIAGFKIIHCERLSSYAGTSAASTNRPAIVFTKKALHLAMGQNMKLSVKERADKNDNVQILLKATFGAVRVHDEKVVDVRFQE